MKKTIAILAAGLFLAGALAAGGVYHIVVKHYAPVVRAYSNMKHRA